MSWEQLKAVIQEAEEIVAQDRSGVPESCATCYTPLRDGFNGTRQCPWDGLVWPDDAAAWGEFPGAF